MLLAGGVGVTVDVVVGWTGLGSAVVVGTVGTELEVMVGSGAVLEGTVGSGVALEVEVGVAEDVADELPEPLLELPDQLLSDRSPMVVASQLLVPVDQPRRRLATSET